MESDIIIDILYNSSKQNDAAVDTCNNIIEQYPYFQMAHMLKSKILHSENKIDFAKAIKNAAIYAPDRSKLHDLIQSKTEPKHAFNKSNVEKWEIETKTIQPIKHEADFSEVEHIEVELAKGDVIIDTSDTVEKIDDTNIVIVDNDESLLAKLVGAETKSPIESELITEQIHTEDMGHHPVFEHVDESIVEEILIVNDIAQVESEVEMAESIISDQISNPENIDNALTDPEAIARAEKVDEILAHIDATLPEAVDRDANEELINQRLKELFSEDKLTDTEPNLHAEVEDKSELYETELAQQAPIENILLEVVVASIEPLDVLNAEPEQNINEEVVLSHEMADDLLDEAIFEVVATNNNDDFELSINDNDFESATEDEQSEIEALMTDGLVLNANETLLSIDEENAQHYEISDETEIIDDISAFEPTESDNDFVEEEIGLLNIELESAYFDIENIAGQAYKTDSPTIEEQALALNLNNQNDVSISSSAEQHDFFGWLSAFQKNEPKTKGTPHIKTDELQDNDEDLSFEEFSAQNEQQGARSRITSQITGVNKDEIIEHFIKADPRIEPLKAEFYKPSNMARKSVEWDENLVSETLADIFRQQGLNEKAIRAYEKLSLAFPEKKHFFADIIKTIKNTD